MKTSISCIIFVLGVVCSLIGQDTIFWKNPSFEGIPKAAQAPPQWESHTFDRGTPPDTQPCQCYGVDTAPYDGMSYVSMTVEEANIWESIGQLLEKPLKRGQTYETSFYANRSGQYLVQEKKNIINYDKAVVIRLWGGTYEQPFIQLLAETQAVEENDWKPYHLIFTPDSLINYLTFETYFIRGTSTAYNGNVMIDALSPIIPTRKQVPPSYAEAVARGHTYRTIQYKRSDYYVYRTVSQPSKLSNRSNKNINNRPEGKTYFSKERHAGRKGRLTRLELIRQAQHEMEAARGKPEKEEKILLYDEPTIVDNQLNRQQESLKRIPSNAESVDVPYTIRQPLLEKGPGVVDFLYKVDRNLMSELAHLIGADGRYTLVIAVHAPQQGVRDKIAWDLDIARQELEIPENIITIEQFTGQNTYFKDWLWTPEEQRVMMRLAAKKKTE